MKKKLVYSMLCAGLIGCSCAGVATMNKVDASATQSTNDTFFEMVGGSIRYDEPTGLRFSAQLDTGSYEVGQSENATYGMVIFPVNVMDKYDIDYTNYNPNTDYITEIKTEAADYFTYMQNNNKTVTYTVSAVPVAVYDEEDTDLLLHYEVRASIGDILYDNLSRDFFGVAYKKVGDTYTYAEFSNSTNVRNVSYVASAAYADTTVGTAA